MKTLITGLRPVGFENAAGTAEVLIENGRIIDAGQSLPRNDGEVRVVDLHAERGWDYCISPGLFDMHVHLREPGFEYKEDIASGTAAAAAGGFTGVACMPNTSPTADNAEVIRFMLSRPSSCRVVPVGAVTTGLFGDELCDFKAMKEAGAAAFSNDGQPVTTAAVMREAIRRAAELGVPVLSHCEDKSLAGNGCMNEGEVSARLGVPGIPGSAEDLMATREMLLALETGCPVHLMHVSTATSVAFLRTAKSLGAPVTAETCPHYFTLTDEAVEKYGTAAKMNPPLRTDKDREAIRRGIADGTLDIIVTDHAPHAEDEKKRGLLKSPCGIIGLETSFALGVTELVRGGYLTLEQLIDKMAARPRQILHQPYDPRLGADSDFFIYTLDEPFKAGNYKSKASNTPFTGFELYGKPLFTSWGGKVTFNELGL